MVLVQREIGPQLAISCVQLAESAGLGRLSLHDAQPLLRLLQLLAYSNQIELGALQPAGGLDLARLELRDTGRFLENHAPLGGVRREHGVHLALLDNRVGVVADARVHEEFFDIAQPALAAVDQIRTLPIPIQPPRNVHLLGVHGQVTASLWIRFLGANHRILERERDRRRPQRLAIGRAGEQYVDHRIAAETLG